MNISDIVYLRLQNQLITNHIFNTPEEIVNWLGAVQAQDYTTAKWAIGLRSKNLNDTHIEDAFNQGKILRTHIIRPTWHFVLPKDIRWMLALTKERVHKLNSYYYKQSGLDKVILQTGTKIIKRLLVHYTHLTREELGIQLQENFNFTKDINLTIGLILMHAELEGVICSGPRRGKQFTYALLNERVIETEDKIVDVESSLANLTLRYF